MKEYIERKAAEQAKPEFLNEKVECYEKAIYAKGWNDCNTQYRENILSIPAAAVVEEENVLKFYYVRSIDEYWIGRRIDNFYYAEYDTSCGQWVWSHSRYLPWGQHVVAPGTLWKEHTYPSEPEEIPFGEWLTGFIKKNNAADVVEVVRCQDCRYFYSGSMKCCTNHVGVVLTDENGFCHHAKRREDEGGNA